MKPNIKIAEAAVPGGGRLVLYEHDRSYCIRLNGQELMHSRMHASELLLGDVGTTRLANQPGAQVLIGGLGLGFTLRSVLENVAADAAVTVVELLPEIVEWNRTFLSGLNGGLLADGRVKVQVGNVRDILAGAPAGTWDAILLDTDNGPGAMVLPANVQLYSRAGLQRIYAALKPGGRLAIWSARFEQPFASRLAAVGFAGQTVPAKKYPNARRDAVTLYVADKPA